MLLHTTHSQVLLAVDDAVVSEIIANQLLECPDVFEKYWFHNCLPKKTPSLARCKDIAKSTALCLRVSLG